MIIMIFFVASFIFSVIMSFYYAIKLRTYLYENHKELWVYITSGPFFGPGCFNSFRSLKFIFGEEDFGETELIKIKKKNIFYQVSMCILIMPSFFSAVRLILKFWCE
ncbi:MAG: hypothetical protein JEZ07_01635 [Phycisphaerae bacterium]|nr:hypothetical protein [Phycisphaerae bacterium]